jgi:hypothetical protein
MDQNADAVKVAEIAKTAIGHEIADDCSRRDSDAQLRNKKGLQENLYSHSFVQPSSPKAVTESGNNQRTRQATLRSWAPLVASNPPRI